MTPPVLWIITLGIAYLIGSVPVGYVLVRVFRNEDVRSTGSGNIGATNVSRSGGKGLGIATLVLDVLKGVIAVVIAQHLAHGVADPNAYPNGYDLAAVAGLFAVLGHIFPVWLGFRGGKGVATAAGVFAALMPLTTLVCLLLFIAVFYLTRYVSLASIVGAVALAVLSVLLDSRHRLIVDLVYIAMPLLVIGKHHGNIQRLLSHTEPKFGTAKSEDTTTA